MRRGDKVKVTTGAFKGIAGSVVKIDLKKLKVYVDKVVSKKRDGTEVLKPVHPSNLTITDIDLQDKRRQEVLGRKVSEKVIEEELKREEEERRREEEKKRLEEEKRKAEEEAKKKEEARKAEEEKAKKASEEEEKPKKARKTAAEEEKVSEKGIDKKIKKEWIKEK